MRELKFRVWCEDEKRFNAYDYAFTTMKEAILEVRPDYDGVTIEQYTGLKDKNGKEIYEGDIVENTYEDVGKVRYEVEWDCGRFIMTSKKPHNLVQIGMGIYPNSSKVIGNIHENPELLEDKK